MERANFFKNMMADGAKHFGKANCYVASEHEHTMYGVRIPYLALQYLLCVNAIMLERIFLFSGLKASGKSTLCYEFLRMLMEYGGGVGSVVETENKTNAGVIRGVVGEELWGSTLQFFRTTSVDKAQKQMQFGIDYYQKTCKDKSLPYGLLWDSLVGSKTEETIAQIAKDGSAKKSFSSEAASLAKYFGILPDKLVGWPMAIFFTRHAKEKSAEKKGWQPPGAEPEYSYLGGTAPDFHCTYHIQTKSLGVIRSPEVYAKKVRLRTEKNNMGPDGRHIIVTIYYVWDVEKGREKKIYVDWDEAAIELLTRKDIAAGPIGDLLHITRAETGLYKCAELSDEPMEADALMRKLEASPELFRKMQGHLGINWNIRDMHDPVAVKKPPRRKGAKTKAHEPEEGLVDAGPEEATAPVDALPAEEAEEGGNEDT